LAIGIFKRDINIQALSVRSHLGFGRMKVVEKALIFIYRLTVEPASHHTQLALGEPIARAEPMLPFLRHGMKSTKPNFIFYNRTLYKPPMLMPPGLPYMKNLPHR